MQRAPLAEVHLNGKYREQGRKLNPGQPLGESVTYHVESTQKGPEVVGVRKHHLLKVQETP